MSTAESKIKLQASDGAEFEAARATAERSITIKNLLDDIPDAATSEEPIPIMNVNEPVLKKVMEWCEHHKNDPPASDDDSDSREKSTKIEEWDQQYMLVDQMMLFEIMLAANYLDIKNLLDLTCKTVANMIKGKSPDQIRKTFNIENDFSEEEEKEIAEEFGWVDGYD